MMRKAAGARVAVPRVQVRCYPLNLCFTCVAESHRTHRTNYRNQSKSAIQAVRPVTVRSRHVSTCAAVVRNYLLCFFSAHS